MSVDMPPSFSDVECRSKTDGQGCILARGTGTCVRGECRVLACEFGWADCNQTRLDGCETPVSTEENCGYCGTECSELETCQSGAMGWTCSAGRLCPPNRFDLDFDEANGCEWRADWLEAEPTLLPFMEISHIVGEEGLWSYSGLIESEPVLVFKGFQVDLPVELRESPKALTELDEQLAVIFDERVVLVGPSPEDLEIVESVCDAAGEFLGVLDLSERALISRHRVEMGTTVYDRDWYLNQFIDDFTLAEMSQCEPCALEGCFSSCDRPIECESCEAISGLCPDFEVFAAEHLQDQIVLLTRRGIVVLGDGPPIRVEKEFGPGVVAGAEFAQLRVRDDNAVLLSGSGRLRFLNLEEEPKQISADMGLGSQTGLNLLAMSEPGAIIERDGLAVLTRPAGASGRVVEFNSAGSAGGAAQRLVAVYQEDAHTDLIFSGSGLFQRLRLSRVR